MLTDKTDTCELLTRWVHDARHRSVALLEDLSDDQVMVPQLDIVNPLIWEIGHVAWFQERWVLREAAGQPPILPHEDDLYDSIAVTHSTRWSLLLPTRQQTLEYAAAVRDRVIELLDRTPLNDRLAYFVKLSVFHEDMHCEAFTYTRQTLGYPAPQPGGVSDEQQLIEQPAGDAMIPGGTFLLGATEEEPFVFDNEKWAHPVTIEPFAIARTTVSQSQFAEFVRDGGYQLQKFWSNQGWNWRKSIDAELPVYWKQDGDGERFLRRDFDQWVPLEPNRAMVHVNWYEADAYCRWAERRLPTEAEWEAAAASSEESGLNRLSDEKSSYPWGEDTPSSQTANMDWQSMHAIDVNDLAASDSAFGCRQMIGNVWEWTADDFLPYPGFVADAYKEYSQPWFGDRKVLRGGCWATRSRLIRNTCRNFFQPSRRDVYAGFRTCAPRG